MDTDLDRLACKPNQMLHALGSFICLNMPATLIYEWNFAFQKNYQPGHKFIFCYFCGLCVRGLVLYSGIWIRDPGWKKNQDQGSTLFPGAWYTFFLSWNLHKFFSTAQGSSASLATDSGSEMEIPNPDKQRWSASKIFSLKFYDLHYFKCRCWFAVFEAVGLEKHVCRSPKWLWNQ